MIAKALSADKDYFASLAIDVDGVSREDFHLRVNHLVGQTIVEGDRDQA